MVTVWLPSRSNSGQMLTAALPSAMLTPLINSSTVTIPLWLQSPTHAIGVGLTVGVGVNCDSAITICTVGSLAAVVWARLLAAATLKPSKMVSALAASTAAIT